MGIHLPAGILVGILSHRNAYGKDRCLEPVLLKHRAGLVEIALVAVVEGYQDRPLGKLLPVQDVIPEIVEIDGGAARLVKSLHVLLEQGGGYAVLSLMLVGLVIGDDGDLGGVFLLGKRRRGEFRLKGRLSGLLPYVITEVIGNVGVPAVDPGKGHGAQAVAEVGLIVKIAGLVAGAAHGEVPEIGDLRELDPEPYQVLVAVILEILGIHGRADDGHLHPVVVAEGLDVPQTLHAPVDAGDIVIVVGIGGKDLIIVSGHVFGQIRYAFHVPLALVVGSGRGIEAVVGGLKIPALFVEPKVLELCPAVAPVAEKIPCVELQGIRAVGLAVHYVRQLSAVHVVLHGVVGLNAEDQVLHLAVLHEPAGGLLHVQHVGAVHDHVEEPGVRVLVELVDGKGARRGAAYDVGVVLVLVLLQR